MKLWHRHKGGWPIWNLQHCLECGSVRTYRFTQSGIVTGPWKTWQDRMAREAKLLTEQLQEQVDYSRLADGGLDFDFIKLRRR